MELNPDKVKYFLMFMGYPRSGHTLVASILNAHPNVICSNQQFIIQQKNIEGVWDGIKSGAFNWKQEVKIAFPPKKDIHVIGDKTGHRTVDYLIKHPGELENFKNMIPWPIKWIHVVRNPYDNMATWIQKSNKKKVPRPTDEALFKQIFPEYKALNEKIYELKKTEDVLTLCHENIIMRRGKLDVFVRFLELEDSDIWRKNVRKTLWKKPRITRRQVDWTPHMKNSITNYLVKKYPWMSGYHHGFGG